jgi:SAM-dependent methyltransferase
VSVAYSERRRLLDAALARHRAALRGVVLEVGAGLQGRRGRFVPPRERTAAWWTVDLASARRPHVVADVLALPVRAGVVDTAVALEVLEYVADPPAALAELHRVLADGGGLVLSVPFLHRIDGPTDRWRFSEHGLRRALAAAGFETVLLEAQGRLTSAVAHLVQAAIARRRHRVTRWGLATLALPLVALARLEPWLGRRPAPDATTGYLAVARKGRRPPRGPRPGGGPEPGELC